MHFIRVLVLFISLADAVKLYGPHHRGNRLQRPHRLGIKGAAHARKRPAVAEKTQAKFRGHNRVAKSADLPAAMATTARPTPTGDTAPSQETSAFVCYAQSTQTVLATSAKDVAGTNYAKNQKGVLYRGDNRSPDVILEEGFRPRGNNKNLREHLGLGDDSFYISTTTNYDVAVKYALLRSGEEQSYVYAISPMHLQDGCWIPGIFQDRALSANQEFAVPGPISPESIVDVHVVTQKDLEPSKNGTSRLSKAKDMLVNAFKKFKLDDSTSAKLKLEDGKLKADVQAPHLRFEGGLPVDGKDQDKNWRGSSSNGKSWGGSSSNGRNWAGSSDDKNWGGSSSNDKYQQESSYGRNKQAAWDQDSPDDDEISQKKELGYGSVQNLESEEQEDFSDESGGVQSARIPIKNKLRPEPVVYKKPIQAAEPADNKKQLEPDPEPADDEEEPEKEAELAIDNEESKDKPEPADIEEAASESEPESEEEMPSEDKLALLKPFEMKSNVTNLVKNKGYLYGYPWDEDDNEEKDSDEDERSTKGQKETAAAASSSATVQNTTESTPTLSGASPAPLSTTLA